MKILFLAPQPFFIDRGTPIAVRLALRVLSSRNNTRIDLLTYHEGNANPLPAVHHHRITPPKIFKPLVNAVGPGLSFKKLLCDFFFTLAVVKLLWRNRQSQFDLIHAVEESVFIALMAKFILGIPYVYDMDSSMARQIVEKWSWCRWLAPVLNGFESIAIKGGSAVIPVCDALDEIALRSGATRTQVLRDISLLPSGADKTQPTDHISDNANRPECIRTTAGLPEDALIALYIGNLESYQGIDLLLEGLQQALERSTDAEHLHLLVIGGADAHQAHYQQLAKSLGIAANTHFLGPRPSDKLGEYLMQADLLVSPRSKGENTPMKIYSYLHSGIPIVATRLPTHTQVLDDTVAVLTEADASSYGEGLRRLFESASLRQEIGTEARALAEQKYTFEVFSGHLNKLYDWLGGQLGAQQPDTADSPC